jgi:hypothetical protein
MTLLPFHICAAISLFQWPTLRKAKRAGVIGRFFVFYLVSIALERILLRCCAWLVCVWTDGYLLSCLLCHADKKSTKTKLLVKLWSWLVQSMVFCCCWMDCSFRSMHWTILPCCFPSFSLPSMSLSLPLLLSLPD